MFASGSKFVDFGVESDDFEMWSGNDNLSIFFVGEKWPQHDSCILNSMSYSMVCAHYRCRRTNCALVFGVCRTKWKLSKSICNKWARHKQSYRMGTHLFFRPFLLVCSLYLRFKNEFCFQIERSKYHAITIMLAHTREKAISSGINNENSNEFMWIFPFWMRDLRCPHTRKTITVCKQ